VGAWPTVQLSQFPLQMHGRQPIILFCFT